MRSRTTPKSPNPFFPTTSLAPTITNNSFMTDSSASQSSLPKGLPGFICKLYRMVNDPSLHSLICWNDQGNSFIISNPETFSKDVLPRYCKHNNFSSFIRQLNMYGFHKIPHVEGGIQGEHADSWEFQNPHFLRGNPEQLLNIKRKLGKTALSAEMDLPLAGGSSIPPSGSIPTFLLEEISAIKRQQESISHLLANLQAENQHLWSETCISRERYQQQQETINKILQFLASVFSTTSTIPMNAKNISLPKEKEPNKAQLRTIGNLLTQNSDFQSLVQELQSKQENGGCHAVQNHSPKGLNLFEPNPITQHMNASRVSQVQPKEHLYEDIDLLQDNIALLDNDLEMLGWPTAASDVMLDDSLPEGIETLLKPSTETKSDDTIDPSFLDFSQLLNSSPKPE